MEFTMSFFAFRDLYLFFLYSGKNLGAYSSDVCCGGGHVYVCILYLVIKLATETLFYTHRKVNWVIL